MECRVIFYFQELTNIQAGDVVGISSRQKSVFRIGQLRTYLQEVGRGDFPDGKPITNSFRSLSEIPASSPQSDAMSRDMKKRGFKFFGTTICYAHLQAAGFIDDHLADCICRKGK